MNIIFVLLVALTVAIQILAAIAWIKLGDIVIVVALCLWTAFFFGGVAITTVLNHSLLQNGINAPTFWPFVAMCTVFCYMGGLMFLKARIEAAFRFSTLLATFE